MRPLFTTVLQENTHSFLSFRSLNAAASPTVTPDPSAGAGPPSSGTQCDYDDAAAPGAAVIVLGGPRWMRCPSRYGPHFEDIKTVGNVTNMTVQMGQSV